jgi:1-phosphofructokinase
MIYTVTFNPCLDYAVHVENFTVGTINRTQTEDIYPGGKGINVSIVLQNLGIENTALGFIGSFTGTQIEKIMKNRGCHTDFIEVEKGFSRINVQIMSKEETAINGQGCNISEQNITALFKKLDALKDGDMLVLAGSIPNTLPSDIYENIMERLQEKQIRIIVDATQDLLLNVLKFHPFLIKPNHHELGDMFHRTLNNDDEITEYALKLKEMGAQNVLVSMAAKGAILVCEDGQVYKMLPPNGKVVNSVGAGDSMVAGFITGYQKTKDYKEALKMGIATGSASAFLPWLAEMKDVEKLLAVM